jgi:hypothetical protein
VLKQVISTALQQLPISLHCYEGNDGDWENTCGGIHDAHDARIVDDEVRYPRIVFYPLILEGLLTSQLKENKHAT